MEQNTININKANNHLSPQLTERKKYHEVCLGKLRSWPGKSTEM